MTDSRDGGAKINDNIIQSNFRSNFRSNFQSQYY